MCSATFLFFFYLIGGEKFLHIYISILQAFVQIFLYKDILHI